MRDFRHKTQSDDFTGNFPQCATYNMLDLPMTRSHSERLFIFKELCKG